MSDVNWLCSLGGIPDAGLTVGTVFEMKCEGPKVSGLAPTSLNLELPKADLYKLQVLEVKRANEQEFHALITTYVPGNVSLESVILTDGAVRIGLKGIEYEVKSVLDPNTKEPKPFPPETPVSLMLPNSVIAAGLFFIVAIGVLILQIFRARRKTNEFRDWLEKNQTPYAPVDQLNKELRRIAKESDPISQLRELERVTREFLARETRVPVLTGSAKSIVRRISAGDRKFRELIAPKTIRLFSELERLRSNLETRAADQREPLKASLPALIDLVSEYASMVCERARKNP